MSFFPSILSGKGSNNTEVSKSKEIYIMYIHHITHVLKCTDLGNLIGNFDCGYSTIWKFSKFSAILILREINFGWLQKVKNCRFNNFEGFEFWFLEKVHTRKCQKFQNVQNSELLQYDQNWFHVKSKWQRYHKISTLCIPN